MKSVLISIQPKWCALIASGEKTIEVRKTRPKIETPFKCYIYETKGKADMPTFVDEDGHVSYEVGGQVIGEFLCDRIDEYNTSWLDGEDRLESTTRLDDAEIMDYMNCYTNRKFYCWHISDLTIYDKPRELSEFMSLVRSEDWEKGTDDFFINGRFYKTLKRPPQSWCYVEEKIENQEVSLDYWLGADLDESIDMS